ncbi:hypothetical protein Daci_3546 [Delftia acidovorans SPH-1]|uniref:Secreted protein n=2 Tax=Delftia acidovorans TaxID=80866 RepID=A9BWG0_DELAS|nr:hypothetical protein [Delftia acidovorans]ABX36180.1 hypothetical protein Daci_3546 [Delftia acidovorans SPH-1]
MIKISSVALMLCTASLVAVASPQNGPTLSIHFEYNPEEYADVRDLQKQLVKALKRSGAGELDEPELHADGNDGYFDIRGRDAEKLYRIVRPILKSSPLMKGAEVTKMNSEGKTKSTIR